MTRDRRSPHPRIRSLTLAVAALALGSTALSEAAAPAAAADPGATGISGTRGHDVSSHQGDVNWRKAKANGAKFVYVKATEGTSYRNPHFAQQFNGSRRAGILHGAYHFAHPASSSGKAQARYFVRNGGQWQRDGWTLPPALDLEAGTNGFCHGLGDTRMRAWIESFSLEVRRLTGRNPVIYTSTRWWRRCAGNSPNFAANHPLWLADWGRKRGPLPNGWSYRSIWQHSTSGALPGDQNLFNGSMDQLRRFARG
ncbi:lysozyme [Streptomyces sp. HNM0574]|uniref:lysozyme n=1 Tax=Streptomyces sp. HNM0574 TaxID=2714954 RepID=UPI00146DB2A3|nr:lysozyme [Streptomyces sp. HNM0574]NLU67440.1 lysozyme [Streptomyces sp. HNM0574]